MSLFGAIEAGGTKFVCAVGTDPNNIRDEIRIATTSPDETINSAIEYFQKQSSEEPLSAIGIGSFGPIDLKKNSRYYGYITTTTKPNWENTDLCGRIGKALNVPIGFDTDVNAAALGEHKWGAAQGLKNFIYLTIGTGIGGGAMINGKLVHGLLHTEMGHIFLPQDIQADPYTGICPFHKNCFEGLASGPAIKNRWGIPAEELGENHKAWELEARYISLALANYICTLSPERIIIGGGVMEQKQLLPLIQRNVKTLLNNYISAVEITEKIEEYIILPALGNKSGILGAIALAQSEYAGNQK
ncbi:ROK family protein [Bacteroidota bacterium]